MTIWLKPNRRALLLGCIPPLMLAGGGVATILALGARSRPLVEVPAVIAVLCSLVLLIGIVAQLVRPRIGYRDGAVFFYLRYGRPIAVPLDVVEGFLMGQRETLKGAGREELTVVARLAERAESWSRREVKPALGSWCDGYVTIRGTWCEPIDRAVLDRLNRRLSAARKERAAA